LRECWQSVRDQVYPHWQWCLCDDGSTLPETLQVLQEIVDSGDARVRLIRLPASKHTSVATNVALTLASGTFVALLDHDDTLAPEALWAMARHLREHPADDLIYSDEDKLDEVGQRCEPAFKPDWSPELLRAWMYPCHLTVIRRSLLDDLGAMRVGFEGAQDYDLWLRASERTQAIGHVPQVLYHWRKSSTSTASSTFVKPEGLARSRRALEEHLERRGVAGRVEPGARPGLWRVRVTLRERPLVSVVLPTDGGRSRDGGDGSLLLDCLGGLVGRTAYRPLEIIVAHNGVLPPGVERRLAAVPHRIVQVPASRPFNFPRKLNQAAAYAQGAYLLLLNDDIVVQHADWLEAMLEVAQDPEVGVVGPRLRYPDGRLQHVGLLLGVCGVVAHAYHGAPADTDGYLSSVLTVRNYSAVTGACLLTRRDVFERVGGFDESFPIDFNDVDYCLRVRRLGLRVVYTPYAELVHHESGTIGPRTQAILEVDRFRDRWAQVLGRDPYYSPNLTRHSPDWGFGEKL
jgi:glycosyltransferase involved in cell wall biosynthesis